MFLGFLGFIMIAAWNVAEQGYNTQIQCYNKVFNARVVLVSEDATKFEVRGGGVIVIPNHKCKIMNSGDSQ